ncbi:Inositol-pentakisphosphate 2-kinase [Ascosphaera atra]|nr:Inositol-pentakisphosphate 2-kinase [Ascosphaera atra]
MVSLSRGIRFSSSSEKEVEDMEEKLERWEAAEEGREDGIGSSSSDEEEVSTSSRALSTMICGASYSGSKGGFSIDTSAGGASCSIVPPRPLTSVARAFVMARHQGAFLDERILTLPPHVDLQFVAEGNANAIFRLIFSEEDRRSGLASAFAGKLLRLRKDRPRHKSSAETIWAFDEHIKPLFEPSEVVGQTLVKLTDDCIRRGNEQLHAAEKEGTRSPKRYGIYLAPERSGILVEEVKAALDGSRKLPSQLFIELKPKWLLQSPSAPAAATRCRTCALREMREHNSLQRACKVKQVHGTGQYVLPVHHFCPLDLVSDDYTDVKRAARVLALSHGYDSVFDHEMLALALYRHPLLMKLRSLQECYSTVSLDDFGNGKAVDAVKRGVSMTLRDCTMFFSLDTRGLPHALPLMNGDACNDKLSGLLDSIHASTEAKLCDLDFKDGSGGKLGYWWDIEARLRCEGWYEGRKADGRDKYSCDDGNDYSCLLSRTTPFKGRDTSDTIPVKSN